jgi:lysophospholipase L1-like esterase
LGGWAERLKKYYFAQFSQQPSQDIGLYNLGIAGENTDGLMHRFESELKARHIKGQQLKVLLAYGANDIVIHKDKNIVPEVYFIRNLKHCIKMAQSVNADVFLLGILPISDSIEGIVNQQGKLRFDTDIQGYNDILKTLSQAMQCEYIDLYSLFTAAENKEKYLCKDGLHPNAKGHELLYNSIKQEIKTI